MENKYRSDLLKGDNAYRIATNIYAAAQTTQNMHRPLDSNFNPDCHTPVLDIAMALYTKIIEYLTKNEKKFDELAKNLLFVQNI